MTAYHAITTCNAAQWEQYGRAMVATFARHWSLEVSLTVYAEGFAGDQNGGVRFVDLDQAAPWLAEFKARYSHPRFNGGSDGRDYRHDAVRFSHKIGAIGAAAAKTACDVLIWLDADIVTHASVTTAWLEGLFPEPAVVAWLDRERTYPECGLLMFRMPQARLVIRAIVEAYRTGSIFRLAEWHDSFVIQHHVLKSGVPVHSLSGPEGRKHIGHPWISSPVAACFDHLKGETRKTYGRSLPQDVKAARVPRLEPYWQ